MTMLAKAETAVARPLNVLVTLIQHDLKEGREAAKRASMPHWIAAGEKLLEAKPQVEHGEFKSWIARHFPLSYVTATRYMAMASEKNRARYFSTQSEFIRETSNPNYNRPPPPPSWHAPVEKIINRVDTETLNLKREELKRAEERDAQRTLALQLIDIGYKVLARKLHPDRGGSRDAMTRLNAVRDRLKQSV